MEEKCPEPGKRGLTFEKGQRMEHVHRRVMD
jgi:hypothetical protein